jgi:hypothetical protein
MRIVAVQGWHRNDSQSAQIFNFETVHACQAALKFGECLVVEMDLSRLQAKRKHFEFNLLDSEAGPH